MDWINENSLAFLNAKSGYLLEGETVESRFNDIGDTLEGLLYKGYKKEFMKYLKEGYYVLSTPFIANVGRENSLPFSCSNQYIGDSLGEIMFAEAETGMMTKMGMGCSAYFDLRGKGASISNSHVPSPGSLYFAEGFNTLIKKINQGVRRGYMAGYWSVWHSDILDVLDIQRDGNAIQDLNYGICIDDKFMNMAKEGDEQCRTILAKIHESRFMTGLPYIFFTDNVNKAAPDVYKDNNLVVQSSNLCVSPETLVLTDKGHQQIHTLENKKASVWNGKEFTKVIIRETSKVSKLLTVNLSDGTSLTCTPGHKWYTQNKYGQKELEVRTSDLVPGDKLIKLDTPIIDSEKRMLYPYTHGFFCGDGTYDKRADGSKKAKSYLYGEKKVLLKYMDNDPTRKISKDETRYTVYLPKDIEEKFYVPLDYSIDDKIKWLEGYTDADGTIAINGGNKSLQICSIEFKFLVNIKLMLQTLGVQSKVTKMRAAGEQLLPKNDGTGDYKYYPTKECYRLLVTSNGLFKLIDKLGYSPNRLNVFGITKPQRSAKQFVKVVNVIDDGRVDRTLCFTEPRRGKAVFNGILTGQCSEILEVSNDKYSFVCDLAAMNALKHEEKDFARATQVLTYALDCLHTSFQTKLEFWRNSPKKEDRLKFMFLEKAYKASVDFRDIGVGLAGYHSLLQSKMIAFESMEAKLINAALFSTIQENTLKASKWLADEYGEPEMLKGYGRRNCLMNAIAPNTSSAFIAGQISQGIEPFFSNFFIKELSKKKHVVKNKDLITLLESKGKNTKKVWLQISKQDGSVQKLDFLSEHEKNVFKTVYEISPMEIIIQAAQRQKFIDQGQSLNLMISAEVAFKDINALFYKAWELDIKTLYYQHGTNAAQQFRKSILECESCAG